MSCLCSVMLCSPRLRHHLLTLCPPGPMPGRQQQLLGMALVAIAANKRHQEPAPSPTLPPTDPVPRGLLTLCPGASSGPQGQ